MLALFIIVAVALAQLSPALGASINNGQDLETETETKKPCSLLGCSLKCLTGSCSSPCGKCKSKQSSGGSKCPCLGRTTDPTDEPTPGTDEVDRPPKNDEPETGADNLKNEIDKLLGLEPSGADSGNETPFDNLKNEIDTLLGQKSPGADSGKGTPSPDSSRRNPDIVDEQPDEPVVPTTPSPEQEFFKLGEDEIGRFFSKIFK